MKQIFFFLFFPLLCLSQVNESNKLPALTPTSPKSFEFLKFTETPVSKYTGIPEISIPIYNIEAKGLTIPIKLNYYSNGFKVEEEAGSAGLGWTLNANWSIIQQVEGFDDFASLTRNRTMPNFANIIDVQCNGSCPSGSSIVSNCDIFLLGLSGAPQNSSTGEIPTAYLFGDNNYVNTLVLGQKDFQPDIFSFTVPGYSGKFILDWKNDQFVCLTDNKVKITAFNYNGVDAPTNFAILVPDGHVFTFTLKEQTIIDQNTSQQEAWPQVPSTTAPDIAGTVSSRAYQLTQIVTNIGDTLYLDYTTTNPIKNYPSVSQSKVFYDTQMGFKPFPNEMSDTFTSYSYTSQPYSYLNKITFSKGVLSFNYSDRIDLVGSKKLDNIELRKTTAGSIIKKIDFSYDYFIGHTSGTNSDSFLSSSISVIKTPQELTHRLKLLSVKETGQNPYVFEYDTEVLPKKTSYAKDYWGNYNGVLTNNSNFIDIYKFNIAREYMHYYDYKDNINSSVLQYAKAAVLNKITYPTGGYTIFDYELNSFSNIKVPSLNQGIAKNFRLSTVQNASLNLDQIVMIEGGNTIFKVSGMLSTIGCYPTYPEAYSSCYFKVIHFKKELMDYIKSNPSYNAHLNSYGLKYVLAVDLDFLDGNPSNPQLYNTYADNEGGKIGKTINLNADEFSSNIIYNLSEGIAYFMVSGGCGNNGSSTTNSSQATFNISYNDYKPILETESVGAGIRVKEIINYSQYYTKATKKSYSYQGGRLMGGMNYFNKVWIPNYGWINIQVNQSVGYKLILNSRNFTAPSGNGQGRFVGYDSVDESNINFDNPNAVEQNGRIREYFVNNPEIGSTVQGFYAELRMPIIQNEKDNGLLRKQEIYDKDNNLLKEISNGYGFVKLNCFSGMKCIFRETKYYTAGNMYGTYSNYTVGVYPIRGSYSPLEVSTEKTYYGSESVTIRTDYTYNAYNQMTYSKSNNSKNDLIETLTMYPKDFPSNSLNNTALLMANKNVLSPIISKQIKKNDILVSNEEFEYFFKSGSNNPAIPNIFTLTKYKNAKGTSPLEPKISYNSYDSFLNLTEVSNESNYNSYIWGYNGQYPIAKIENSQYSSITPSLITAAQTASNTGTEAQLLTALDNIRTALPSSLVTTYTYLPLIGVSTITDPKGNKITYSYDSANRLEFIKDKDLNVLQRYCYNFIGQQTDCTIGSGVQTIYKSVFKSAIFTKQSCGAGYIGSPYTYTVPAGMYSSTVSQVDADNQANTEITAYGQNFVNVNGNCILIIPPPTGLTFISATASSVNFSWTAVSGATGYKIYKNGIYTNTVSAPVTTGSLSGLTASTTYSIQVLATNGTDDGSLSPSVSMSTLPSAPIGLVFNSATASSINFSWTPVTGAVGYKIYKDGAYVSSIAAPATTGSLSGLTASTSYGVQILATNASGDGSLSGTVSMSTLPLAPTGLVFANATSTSINFAWTTVAGATGYKIYKDGTYVSSVNASTTTGSLSGLTASTFYGVQILATNASGDGPLSGSVSMSTSPSIPTGLLFTSATSTSLNFSWTAVTGATSYKIYRDGIYVSSVTAPVTSGVISGLVASTNYSIQILATNVSGDGAYSAAVSMSTAPSAPTGLTLTSATVSSLNFSWTPVSGAAGYKIYKDGAYNTSVTTTIGNISGLTIGTSYNIQVLAYNASGNGDLSSPTGMSTIVAAPISLGLTNYSTSTLSLIWSAVSGATEYRIYKNGNYVNSVSAPITIGSLSGLTPATTYGIQVKAANASGEGAFSSLVSMTTAPTAPPGLVFNSATSTSVGFYWTAVTGATGYKIYKDGIYINSVTAPTNTSLLTGLTGSTSYNVKVLAYTENSNSDFSPTVPMLTLPAVPTGLSFTNSGISSLNFSWSAVPGAVGYKIYKNGVFAANVSSTTGSLSGLSAATAYSIQVLAYNATGDGGLSSSVQMTTSPAVLGFYKTSGAYPATGGAGLNGTIVNPSIHTLYVYTVIQSASASSGTGSGYVNINGSTIGAGGSFTQYGQNFISNNYVMVTSGSTVPASGSYGGATGSQMILAYSSYPGGALTYWSTAN
ncbi:fibronectin type III domain-containing protein [Flavobacterium sp. HTF]|uniref:fibronectin type III domain-containing protein n=1 Tax=Flavobacterium sp. HTF TaxID=2170732 RepID=UPI000D5D7E8A|nr:fibronectin type III domain-containing protein [Flavobacterium sp. HTF]PWB20801.1 hypothetical protein DCO46_20030 [Flavobacterium sp. HTF]